MTILPLETREQFFYYRLGHLVRESTPLHAVEHSGWVEGERRQKIEALFNNSSPGSAEVNLVVASPTLEMGVDLKKLPAVLLRNVPPSPASYRQRIGRAGRESKAGLAITHTRASPYDSMFFDEPNRLIKGRIGSLIMPIDNQLVISRHVYAHLLETAPSEILESLRFWRNLMFDDSSPQSEMSLEAVPSPTRFTERLIVPLSRHAIEKKDELNRVFSNCNPEDIEKIGLGVEGRLRPILDYWCIRYQQLVVEIRKASAANLTIGGASGDEASRAVKRARNQLLTHLGFNRQNGYKSVRDWAPLFFLADRGFLPRYEFPGDTLALTCFSSKEDPYEVLDDKFKAHRDWAPSAQKDRFVWALGGKFRPAYFRVEAEGKIPDRIRVCRDHNFISKNIEDVCPSCTSTSTATINLTPLQPIKVDATRDGAIGDDSEDRGVAGLDIQTYITADNGTFLDTLSEEASVNPAAGVALLHKRSNTRVIQIVSPSRFGNAETYEYCELCSALRTPPRQADQDTPAQWHSRKCPRFNQPPANGQNQSGVVLMAERERTDAIELRLPPVFGFEGDFEDSDIDIHRSLLEALLRSAREVCELGPRGEGIAADVFNDRENFLIFYDPIEGGSGTIKELWHRRDEWFETALSRVADRIDGQTNGCDCERACDRCLLDYGNQRFHLRISRHAAKRILQAFKHENKFWSESVKSSKSPDISDPVSYDNSSPLEKYFAEMVSWHFGVRGSQLRSQMDAFPHERITRPDYQSGINNRFLFIDGRDPHEKWEVLTEDFRKRNLMTFRGKAWTVLTHTSLRNCQSIIPATLKWLGVTNEVPATWSPLPPMQHGQFDNRTLNTQQVNEIVSIFKSALHMHSSGESSDFSVVDPIIGADVWSLNGFGNLFSFTDSDGKNCVVRYAVKDEYNFHDYQLGNAVMAINDISVYQVALSNQEWSKIRDVVSVVKAQI